jgi:non-specific serine/threonine protein kinase
LFELGRTVIFRGDPQEGNRFVTEGLVLSSVRRDRWQMIAGFELLAEVAAMRGLPERAGLLLGAAAALREAIGVSAELIHDSGDPVAVLPRSHSAFANAWEAGKALSLDEAVALALTEEPTAASVASGRTGDPVMTHGLTQRERVVLQRIATGQSNRQIAHALSLSERTVENHVRHILAKLDLPSRTAAAAFAIRQGLA